MKCISVRQPWAWLIVRPDLEGLARAAAIERGELKTIENRTWRTRHRGALLIHAAQGMALAQYEAVQRALDAPGAPGITLPPPHALRRGGIVGVGMLADCLEPGMRQSWWHMPGCFGFELQDVRPTAFVPLKGRLMLFDVDASVLDGTRVQTAT